MPPDYLSVTEAARLWHRSPAAVRRWCADKLIPGAVRIGNRWAVPIRAQPPALPRGRPPGKHAQARKE